MTRPYWDDPRLEPSFADVRAAQLPGSGRWLVPAGQVGMTRDGAVPPDPVEQLRVTLGNVEANLEAAGMSVFAWAWSGSAPEGGAGEAGG